MKNNDDEEDASERRRLTKLALEILRLHGNHEGAFYHGTLVAIIRTDPDHLERMNREFAKHFGPLTGMSSRNISFAYLIAHEWVHFYQVLTTAYTLNLALDVVELVSFANYHKQVLSPLEAWLPSAATGFSETLEAFEDRTQYGYSIADLIEAHAVICGFKGFATRYSKEGLLLILSEAHDLDDRYSGLIGNCLRISDINFTLYVLPKIIWLALQTSNPLDAFGVFFKKAKDSYNTSELLAMNAEHLCGALGVGWASLRDSVGNRISTVVQNPLFELWRAYEPGLKLLCQQEGGLDSILDFPTSMNNAEFPKELFQPPLTIVGTGEICKFTLHGPLKDKGWSVAAPLLEATHTYAKTIEWLSEKTAGNRETGRESL